MEKVVITSACPLSDKEDASILKVLKKELGENDFEIEHRITPEILGGFQIEIASTLIDLSLRKKLFLLEKELNDSPLEHLTPKAFREKLETMEKEGKLTSAIEKIGRIISIKDDIVCVEGMRQTKAGELITFTNGSKGIAFNLYPDKTDVVLLGDTNGLKEGDLAYQTEVVPHTPTGKGLLGRIINALGEPIDDIGDIKYQELKPIEAPVPGIVDRQSVTIPLQTGIKVIDALVPIGLGQRELIIGDRQTGKTSLIIDAILAQKERNEQATSEKEKIYCIYVAVGQKQSTLAEIVRTLKDHNALDYTCIVSASASDTATMQYLAPFTGTTIGEYFRDNGMNALIFYDDLTKHANAYRQISLLLKRPPGREAYPGDIFYLHSRLLERSAMMSDEKGGGSLTAIPVIETQESDVSAYIPTNVISITDGQIFLETSLFHQGIRPAVNVGLSVSRVGSKAQRPLLAKLSGSMKLELAQYREMLSFSQIASDLDESAQSLLRRGVRITEVLKQKKEKPLSFSQEFIIIYAVLNGYFDNLEPNMIPNCEEVLFQNLEEENYHITDIIEERERLSDEDVSVLNDFLRDFVTDFLSKSKK
ncbi:MAG: F0F1 ATP synthase subunit alpha [Alphaproteobacteria bacterium]|nr:F0F1 ATP synthase subunit alpha [Alphaproteobacteria bacterium]